MIKKYYKEILFFFSFAALIIIFTYPIIFKMSTAVYGPIFGTDSRGTIWDLWWLKYAWLHNIPSNFITMYAHPFGAEVPQLASLNLSFYKWVTFLTNELFTYNLSLLSNFLLAAVITYFLVYQLTKNKLASFVSGIIFAFNPYCFNKSWEHFALAQTFWVPLYSLVLLNMWRKPVIKSSVSLAIVLSLMISFELNYTYIMGIFTLGFTVFVMFHSWQQKNIKSFLRFIKILCFSMLITALINLHFIYPIVKTIFFTSKTDIAIANVYVRSFHYLFTHSARPLSYLLPASSHPVFGNFTKSMFGSIFYGRNSIEQTLYLGWLPLILSFIAYKTWKRKKLDTRYSILDTRKDNFTISLFIFTAILGFAFSMPPYINLGLFKIYFPSFFMYKILSAYRAYARFGVLVIFAVSVLAGFGLKYILEKIQTPQRKALVAFLVTCFILFEFINIPPFRVTDLSNPPEVYRWLKEQKGNFAIAEYPMAEAGLGEAQMNYDYLFYQRIHQKPLINGAPLGSEGYGIRKKISNLMKPTTPGILKHLGAKYVIIDFDKYKNSKFTEIIRELPDFSKQKGLKLVKKFEKRAIYEVVAEPINPGK